MTDPDTELDPELRLGLEAILLVVEEPVPANTLAQVLEIGEQKVVDGLRQLRREYLDDGHGFVLREVGGGWRLYTAPQAAEYVERWVTRGRTGSLSRAALETLAIVAYKQPVTRATISQIRGVDADGAVRTLLSRDLIEAIGREDTPGQPVLYATTTTFLEQIGLGSVAELPALGVFAPPGPPPDEPPLDGYRQARRDVGRVATPTSDDHTS
ncbi:MAG TPA: SMC-Scp complex subunit ScpB [Euzebyales bacterium]|nr:SMC-Scp complex subunit ScpB [Euzebyales bacterium]